MESIVLAGGFGTRLASVVSDVPKPMAPVGGIPFLQYVMDYLVKQKVMHVVMAVSYKKEVIMNYFGQEYKGAHIDYSIETIPLGTGGAIKKALSLCHENRVFVLNGDSFLNVDLAALRRRAEKTDSDATIALKVMKNFDRYGTVAIDAQGNVISFQEKTACREGLINAGIYDLKREILQDYSEKFSMEQECFSRLVEKQKINSMICEGYFVDIGIPEDYARIQKERDELLGE